MGVYIEFIKKAFRQKSVYKFNLYMYILRAILNLFVMVSVWTALYKGNTLIKGISYSDMINFTIINILVDSFISSNIANVIADKVKDGSVAMDFIKPINFKYCLFAGQVGENSFRTVYSTLPVCIFAAIFLGFRFPENFLRTVLFLVSITLGVVLIYHINYILGLLAFWLKSSFYSRWFLYAFFSLFGGTAVPLWFYPKMLYEISRYLPFRFVSFEPIAIYLGKTSDTQALVVIAVQVLWVLALIGIEKFIWSKAQTIVTIHGG